MKVAKRCLLLLLLCCTTLLGAIDLNKATKKELMGIKGIGEKKASLIIELRKKEPIKNVESLRKLKGFGPKLINEIKRSIKKGS